MMRVKFTALTRVLGASSPILETAGAREAILKAGGKIRDDKKGNEMYDVKRGMLLQRSSQGK
jgi:hypothetical protein